MLVDQPISGAKSAPPGRWSMPGQTLVVTAFWLLIALGSWLQMWLFSSAEPVAALKFAGVQWLPWVLLTPLIFWLSAKFAIERGTWLRNIWIHLLACLLIVAALGGLFILHGPPPFGKGFGGGDHGSAPKHNGGPASGRAPEGGRPPNGPGDYSTDHGADGRRPSSGTFGPPPGDKPGPPPDHGQPHRGRSPSSGFWMIMRLGAFQLPTFWAVLGAAHALVFYKRAQDRGRRETELQSHLTQARLEALRMQLNPHFLFNTLNSIASLVHEDPNAADRMIGYLSDLLRLSLKSSGQQEVSLREELYCLDLYLSIEQVRFGERLRVEKNIEPAALDAIAPMLILQPLVENAIKHGLEAQLAQGVIAIAASRVGDSLHLQVADNGRGFPASGVVKEGVGLSNTRSRLRELYGPRGILSVQRREGGGFQAEVSLPWRSFKTVETVPAIGTAAAVAT